MDNPPEGINIIATFTDGTEARLYFWEGAFIFGVPSDDLDIEIEPTAILSWVSVNGN